MKRVCLTACRVFNVVWPLILAILLILLSRSCEAKWYSGIIHVHSTFSDGTRPPVVLKTEAASLFLSFMVVTDHFEQINSEKKWTGKYTDDFGLDKYLKDYTFEKPYVCVAGTEISKNGSHTIAMRNIDKVYNIEKIGPSIQDLLVKLSMLNALPIACHPNLKKYPYDLSVENAAGLDGVEMFNDSGRDGYNKTLRSYLDLISQGRKLFVTSGCDSHTEAQVASMRKLTMVWSDKDQLTSEELFKSFEQGQTYATNNGAYFKNQNLIPQFNTQEVDRPRFEFAIGFPIITVSKKIIRIYRDGKLADGSSITLPFGKTEYTYLWEDTQALKGEHSYVIEMEGCLVTSPIYLDVKDTKPISLVDNKIVALYSNNGDNTASICDQVSDFTFAYEVNVAKREGSVFFRLSPDELTVGGLPTKGRNGYGVIFCPFSGQGANPGIYIVKRVDGYEGTLAYRQINFPRTSGRTQFRIEVKGDRIKVRENNNIILEIVDDSFKSGRLVWRVYGDQFNPAKATFKMVQFEHN